MVKIKQAIIIPVDVKMSPGKLAAQAAHASVGAVHGTHTKVLAQWREFGSTKIVLQAENEGHLFALQRKAINAGLPTFLVADAGRTEVTPGTITALAIGPGDIDSITGSLPLLR